jgi:mannose-6-phosphate isomerase-like protein (cupin superfamily)
MDAFELAEVISKQQKSGRAYYEFLHDSAMSMGVYALTVGGVDPQKPHSEDEIYLVLSGKATIRVGKEDRAVQEGSIVFVGAQVQHHFHSITEDLNVLVFFAPAEYSQATRA